MNWDEKTKTKQLTSLRIRLEDINQKILAKEGKLKRYRNRVKQCNRNSFFQNNERKFYQQLEGEYTRWYQGPDVNETKLFSSKTWQWKEHNSKAEWINNMEKELHELEGGHEIAHSNTQKRHRIVKRQTMKEYMDSGFKIHVYSRQTGSWTE